MRAAAALNQLLEITIPALKQEGGTMVIPGHGRIADEADVSEYRDMVTIVRDRVRAVVAPVENVPNAGIDAATQP